MSVVSPPRPDARPGTPPRRMRTRAQAERAERRGQAHRLWPLSWALVLLYVMSVSMLSPLLDGASWWLGIALTGTIVLTSAAAARSIGAQTWIATLIASGVWLALLVLFFAPDESFAL